jgi:condensin complex subunit 1
MKYSHEKNLRNGPCLLERTAVLALCKIMCVSSIICQKNLDLIFSFLNSRIDDGVKTSIILALGDLFNRFPNQLKQK